MGEQKEGAGEKGREMSEENGEWGKKSKLVKLE